VFKFILFYFNSPMLDVFDTVVIPVTVVWKNIYLIKIMVEIKVK
jgi:hypothetical protein